MLRPADGVRRAVLPVVGAGGEVEEGLAVPAHAEALQVRVLDAEVGPGDLLGQLRVVLLRQGQIQPLLRHPGQCQGVLQGHLPPLLLVVHQGEDMARVQIADKVGLKEEQVQIPVGLRGVEQATVVIPIRTGWKGALQEREVAVPQAGQGPVDGGQPLVGFLAVRQDQSGDLQVVAVGVVVLDLHHHQGVGGLAPAGDQPAAGEDEQGGKKEEGERRTLFLTLKQVTDASLRLPGGAGEGSGEGGGRLGLFHGLISFRYAEGAQSSRVKKMRLTCSPSKKNRRASP